MLNHIWLALIVCSVLLGGWNNRLNEVTGGAFDGAKTAVMAIALPLVGAMCIWLGIMRLAERSGLVQVLARTLRPLLRRLFPDVPAEHPAMGSMVMNIAANMLGLGNAATPLGLRAMGDLERLNPHPGTATNAMCTFLAINTSSVQLLPTTAIAILAANGSKEPTAIVGTALLATTSACVVGVCAAKALEKLPVFAPPRATVRPAAAVVASPQEQDATQASEEPAAAQTPILAPLIGARRRALNLSIVVAVVGAAAFFYRAVLAPGFDAHGFLGVAFESFLRSVRAVSMLAVPGVLAFFPLYAAFRGVKVYEQFVEGAKEGFPVALRIIPFLVTMLVAIGMFRGSGGMDLLTHSAVVRYLFEGIGFPPDLLPMVLMRPLSGSGTQGLFTDLVTHFGPDSLIARTAGTIYGSTETTFYVIAVYFGSVAVRRTRHAIAAGLLADLMGVVVSVLICRLMFHG